MARLIQSLTHQFNLDFLRKSFIKYCSELLHPSIFNDYKPPRSTVFAPISNRLSSITSHPPTRNQNPGAVEKALIKRQKRELHCLIYCPCVANALYMYLSSNQRQSIISHQDSAKAADTEPKSCKYIHHARSAQGK